MTKGEHMVVGILKLQFRLFGVASLKEKRKIIKRLIHRIQTQFQASVAEVGLNEIHQSAEIGVALVGNEGRQINSRLDKMVDTIEGWELAVISDSEMEIIHL